MENEKIYEGFIGLRTADPRARGTRWVGPFASVDEVKEGLRQSMRENPQVWIEAPIAMMQHGAEFMVYGIANRNLYGALFGVDPVVECGSVRGYSRGMNLEFIRDGHLEDSSKKSGHEPYRRNDCID